MLYTEAVEIKSTLTNHEGQILEVAYHDMEQESDLGDRKVQGVHAYCFCKDKLVTEIKLIDPKDYKQYFDWGEIGDRLIDRAMQIKAQEDV